MKNYGIILGSGTGNRFGGNLPKQFAKIAGKTIFEHAINAFEQSDVIDGIIVVVTPKYIDKAYEIIGENKYKKVLKVLCGGETRTESSSIGVSAVDDNEANVLIHDCARPCVSQRIISDCVKALEKNDAVGVAIPSSDTIIQVKDNFIESIPQRSSLRRIQTPQCFRLSLIKKAHELAKKDKEASFTDDCGLIVKYGLGKVYIVEGDMNNIKITYPEDLFLATKILNK